VFYINQLFFYISEEEKMLKKKLIWLVIFTFLAALILSSTVFADGEVPNVPPAEVPNAPAAEVPPALPSDPAVVEAAPATV
jgi:hypothetical protein